MFFHHFADFMRVSCVGFLLSFSLTGYADDARLDLLLEGENGRNVRFQRGTLVRTSSPDHVGMMSSMYGTHGNRDIYTSHPSMRPSDEGRKNEITVESADVAGSTDQHRLPKNLIQAYISPIVLTHAAFDDRREQWTRGFTHHHFDANGEVLYQTKCKQKFERPLDDGLIGASISQKWDGPRCTTLNQEVCRKLIRLNDESLSQMNSEDMLRMMQSMNIVQLIYQSHDSHTISDRLSRRYLFGRKKYGKPTNDTLVLVKALQGRNQRQTFASVKKMLRQFIRNNEGSCRQSFPEVMSTGAPAVMESVNY